jgi:hypothetical protein
VQKVDLHRVAHVRRVSGPFENDELASRVLREGRTPAHVAEPVLVSMDDEHRAANPRRQFPGILRVERRCIVRRDEGLRVGLQAPADAVLDGLRRMRLREDFPDEEVDPVFVSGEPVVPVVLRPALVDFVLLLEVVDGARGYRLAAAWIRGPDEHSSGDAVGMVAREDERALSAHGEAGNHRPLGLGGVQDGDRVGCVLALAVSLRLQGTVRLAVPTPVEGHDATVAREMRDLHLPVARVEERPRGEEQYRRFALAAHLVEDPHTLALDIALVVGIARAGLLALRPYFLRRRHCSFSLRSIQASIQSRSSRWPVMPASRSRMIPELKVMTKETSASSGISSP